MIFAKNKDKGLECILEEVLEFLIFVLNDLKLF